MLEELLAGRIEVFGRDRPVRLGLAIGVEGQLDLHTARIVNEELPERRLGDDELDRKSVV